MNLNGGGLLPVSVDSTGCIKFLFGLERDYWIDSVKGYSDFGGACQNQENRFQTACREAEEEMVGFLGTLEELKKNATDKLIISLKSPKYDSFLYYTPFDEKMPSYFNKNFACVEKHKPEIFEKDGIYEKRQIEWFSFDELILRKEEFRKFYADEFIPQILEKKTSIEKKVNYLNTFTINSGLKATSSLLNIKLLQNY